MTSHKRRVVDLYTRSSSKPAKNDALSFQSLRSFRRGQSKGLAKAMRSQDLAMIAIGHIEIKTQFKNREITNAVAFQAKSNA